MKPPAGVLSPLSWRALLSLGRDACPVEEPGLGSELIMWWLGVDLGVTWPRASSLTLILRLFTSKPGDVCILPAGVARHAVRRCLVWWAAQQMLSLFFP